MKKLFLLLALITFVNCTKDDDDDVQFDPLYSKPEMRLGLLSGSMKLMMEIRLIIREFL